jgi:hypothetical protein
MLMLVLVLMPVLMLITGSCQSFFFFLSGH